MTEHAPLRDRLLALRADLLRQLADAEAIEPAWLATLAGVAAALEALDGAGLPGTAEPMLRAVVTDPPGLPITLAFYAADGRAVGVEVSPIRAIALAGRLVEAALPRLRDAGPEPAYSKSQHERISH